MGVVVARYRDSGAFTHLGLGNRIVGGTVHHQIALIREVERRVRSESEWQITSTGPITSGRCSAHSAARGMAERRARAALHAAQDTAIRDVGRDEEALGLAVVTDGEFRRLWYWNRFVEQVDGLEVGEGAFRSPTSRATGCAFTAPHVTGKVRRTAPISGHEVSSCARSPTATSRSGLALDDAVLVRSATVPTSRRRRPS